ncbi:MAG: metal ABC transporter permease [Candidatus Odyssella sp.]|nr:metal ABC transporter permease [Candidatus Odyssella sp.]
MDDFLVRALLAGLGVAVVAGPFGCFVVWRRMAYFGETLAHTALFGVALGVLLEVDLIVGMIAAVALGALLLGFAQRDKRLGSDAILGILASLTLAGGVIAVSLAGTVRIDLFAFLFGDILAVRASDLYAIWGAAGAALAALVWLWRPMLSATLNDELARIDGVRVDAVNLLLMLLLALVIAVAGRMVGILLVVALLVIPAAAARRFARTPEQMALGAAAAGAVAVAAGLWGSFRWDTPTGPSMVVAAGLVCLLAWIVPRRRAA